MRRLLLGTAVLAVTVLSATSLAGQAGAATTAAANAAFSAIPNSLSPTTDANTGAFSTGSMSVEIVLAPTNQSRLQALLKSTYDTNSASYQHWLNQGQFAAQFAPSRAQVSAVDKYLASAGLTVQKSSSPFLVRASGSSAKIAAAFQTRMNTYRSRGGVKYFSNSTAAHLPTNLAAGVLGVVGLTNTVREHDSVQRPSASKTAKPQAATTPPNCETPYPTTAQLSAAVNQGIGFPYGYGGGPGCSGLTPSQTNSLYSAPNVGARGKGAGVNLAVFELSAYQQSDIKAWTNTFYGPTYRPPLVDVTVDGGPLNPACPTGDTCPPDFNGYAGDVEVDADIEMQLALSPSAHQILVYNAPNDFTGQTELDELTQIANDNRADVVSSSWAVCENDVSAGYVQAENVLFEQMALQGQSAFGAEGDTGAFSCIRSDGTTIPNLLDPPAQPWVTSVGGTSFESDNPGAKPSPAYPNNVETVWNVDNLCNSSASELGQPGFFWCAATGAGGGGSSEYWGRPIYQVGPGINNASTVRGNGTTQCSLAKLGTACRETPDISANADEYTPYAEFCTANANTPNSQCGFSADQPVAGWFGIGGTSLSSPLWSAIVADRDSFQHYRTGNVNPLLYLLYNIAPHVYFHDIVGAGHTTNNNGLYPATSGYDLATGIGTPIMSAIITRTL